MKHPGSNKSGSLARQEKSIPGRCISNPPASMTETACAHGFHPEPRRPFSVFTANMDEFYEALPDSWLARQSRKQVATLREWTQLGRNVDALVVKGVLRKIEPALAEV